MNPKECLSNLSSSNNRGRPAKRIYARLTLLYNAEPLVPNTDPALHFLRGFPLPPFVAFPLPFLFPFLPLP